MKKMNKKIKDESDPLDRDLSELTRNGNWRPFNELFEFYEFESKKKDTTITLRVPTNLLAELKKIAAKDKTDYQKLIRKTLIELVIKRSP